MVIFLVECPPDSFHCMQSKMCIPKDKKCDHVIDCKVGNEDENDCVALTDSSTIKIDKDGRSELRKDGIISISHKGKWHPLCNADTSKDFGLAEEVCEYLGY